MGGGGAGPGPASANKERREEAGAPQRLPERGPGRRCRIQGAGVSPCLEPEVPRAHPPPDVTNATMGTGSE